MWFAPLAPQTYIVASIRIDGLGSKCGAVAGVKQSNIVQRERYKREVQMVCLRVTRAGAAAAPGCTGPAANVSQPPPPPPHTHTRTCSTLISLHHHISCSFVLTRHGLHSMLLLHSLYGPKISSLALPVYSPAPCVRQPPYSQPRLPAGVLDRPAPVLNFCANNYLGLSNHPAVVASAKQALDTHGFGLSSVRFICGTQVRVGTASEGGDCQ